MGLAAAPPVGFADAGLPAGVARRGLGAGFVAVAVPDAPGAIASVTARHTTAAHPMPDRDDLTRRASRPALPARRGSRPRSERGPPTSRAGTPPARAPLWRRS